MQGWTFLILKMKMKQGFRFLNLVVVVVLLGVVLWLVRDNVGVEPVSVREEDVAADKISVQKFDLETSYWRQDKVMGDLFEHFDEEGVLDKDLHALALKEMEEQQKLMGEPRTDFEKAYEKVLFNNLALLKGIEPYLEIADLTFDQGEIVSKFLEQAIKVGIEFYELWNLNQTNITSDVSDQASAGEDSGKAVVKDEYSGWQTFQGNNFEIKCPPDWYCQQWLAEAGDVTISPKDPGGPMAEWLTINIKVNDNEALNIFNNHIKYYDNLETGIVQLGEYEAEWHRYETEVGKTESYNYFPGPHVVIAEVVIPQFNDQTPYLSFIDKILASFKAL